MVIKGARTIAEYRQIQAEKIQNWIAKESWWNEVKDREIKECIKSNYGLIWRNRRGKKED